MNHKKVSIRAITAILPLMMGAQVFAKTSKDQYQVLLVCTPFGQNGNYVQDIGAPQVVARQTEKGRHLFVNVGTEHGENYDLLNGGDMRSGLMSSEFYEMRIKGIRKGQIVSAVLSMKGDNRTKAFCQAP